MQKNYLMPRQKPIKAQNSWATGPINSWNANTAQWSTQQNPYAAPAMSGTMQGGVLNNSANNMLNNTSTVSQQNSGGLKGIKVTNDEATQLAGMAIAPIDAGINSMFDKSAEKSYQEDSYGNEIVSDADVKKEKTRGYVSNMFKDASKGASTGASYGGPVGAIIGGVAGLATGFFKGRKNAKNAEADQKDSKENFASNLVSTARSQDQQAAQYLQGLNTPAPQTNMAPQGIYTGSQMQGMQQNPYYKQGMYPGTYGKQGMKLGNFRLQKKPTL